MVLRCYIELTMKDKLITLVRSFLIAVMLVAAVILTYQISILVLPIVGVSGSVVLGCVLTLTGVIYLCESFIA